MSIGYRLTLAGDVPLEEVAVLAAPEATEKLGYSGERVFSAALNEERGYVVDISAGRDGYYDAEDDGGVPWVWEPDTYVDVDFFMVKDDLVDKGIPNMLAAVTRVLAGTTADAALVFDGNVVVLTRVAGKIHKRDAAAHYDTTYGAILPST
jgi:hypothetical protein